MPLPQRTNVALSGAAAQDLDPTRLQRSLERRKRARQQGDRISTATHQVVPRNSGVSQEDQRKKHKFCPVQLGPGVRGGEGGSQKSFVCLRCAVLERDTRFGMRQNPQGVPQTLALKPFEPLF